MISILTSNSSRTVLDALSVPFAQSSGERYSVVFDSARTMLQRIRSGESGDLVILESHVVADLEKAAIVRAGTRRAFARSRVGVAVRAGAPWPDISSVEAFRRAMLAAPSVAHTVHGASGRYVPVLFDRLGIAAAMKPKTVTRPGGYIGGVVVSGEAELAVQQIVELKAVPGLDIVGPLPDEIQKVFETSAGTFSGSSRPAEAEALLRFLLAPANAGAFTWVGLEQMGQ
ncbi:MAG: substrate-binding domain-containing protein [Burkholderiales bacterium]|nr:substrate-binding domain-containing protein [Burkholderiales bacterium]